MLIHRIPAEPLQYGKFAHGRKSYFMGRWYVVKPQARYSAPAYVSVRTRTPRVSARGAIHVHSRG